MEEIVYEVIVGAIILGVILLVIALFRSGVTSIKETVNTQAELDNIADYDLIGVDGGIYSGAKIQEAYAFSQVASTGLDVIVKNGEHGTSERVTTEAKAKSYPSSNRYVLHVSYLTKSCNHMVPSADISSFEGGRGDSNIAEIRFTYVKQ